MRNQSVIVAVAAAAMLLAGQPGTRAATTYQLDAAHTGVVFKIMHLGLSHTFGRFNEVKGRVTLDGSDAAKSSFEFAVNPASIDTGNEKRDEHLRSPDFFNVNQHRTIGFKSTKVAAVEGGYEVTGDLTLHGVTKPITVTLRKLGEATNRQGKAMVGMETEFTIKRSDYGMTNMVGPVGDEVHLVVSFEAIGS